MVNEQGVTVEEATESLTPEEIEMGQKHGLVEKPAEGDQKPAEKKPDVKPGDQKPPAEDKIDIKTLNVEEDLTEEQRDKIRKDYSPNEVGLYFRMRDEIRKRKATRDENELLKVKLSAAEKDKAKAAEKKAADPDASEEGKELDELFGDKKEPGESEGVKDPKKQPLTKQDLEDMQAKQEENKKAAVAMKSRIDDVETILKAEHPDNWEHLCECAQEVMKEDLGEGGTGTLYPRLYKAIGSHDVDKAEVIKLITKYAGISGKFDKNWKRPGTPAAKAPESKKNDVDRILENQKKRSSAELGGGKGEDKTNLDNLTLEDVRDYTPAQWAKLPRETRDRLLAL